MSPSKLQQIVRLRDMLKKWRRLARKASSVDSLIPRSLSSSSISGHAAAAAPRVPAGHLAVYVGEERQRFVIKTSHLSHPLFRALLKKTEEEMGFHHQGALAIPCEPAFFKHLLCLMGSKSLHNGALDAGDLHDSDHGHHHHHQQHLRELLDFYFTPDNLAAPADRCALQQSNHALYNFCPVSQAVVG